MPDSLQHALRVARVSDAEPIAALFRLVYESSSHPCKREAFVADTLRDELTNVWFVSETGGRVTGCMGLLRHRWNRS